MIVRALNGDQQAFRSIVEEYQGQVFAICLQVVHDRFEAENLTQETFLQIYRSLSAYEFRGFKTWISRIALNKAIDFKRKAVIRTRQENISMEDAVNSADPRLSVQDYLIREEEKILLKECLGRIPEQYRSVIRKSYEENKSCKEIAFEENISVRTVETRLYRGKKILRECFEELSKS